MTLKDYLALPNVTVRGLADRAGISATAMSMFSNGLRSPTLKTAMRIVDATAGVVNLDDLASAIPPPEASA